MVYLVLYLIGAVFSYGHIFAYWQGKYPILAKTEYCKDICISIGFSLVWVIGLILSFCSTYDATGKFFGYGLKYR